MSRQRDDEARASLVVAAPASAVWRALLDRRTWWPELAFEPVVGAPLLETWTEDGRILHATGHITAVDQEQRLAFEWTEPGWLAHLSVVITLMTVPGGTEVAVRESDFTSITAPCGTRGDHEEGWRHHLDRLSDACTAPGA